jgi:hypothetical protein
MLQSGLFVGPANVTLWMKWPPGMGQRREMKGCYRRHESRDMKKVSLITDGSCLGNPGPGGGPAFFGSVA